MKKLIIFLSVLIFIGTYSFAYTNVNSGNVSGTWTKINSPYKIQGDITIALNQKLIIEHGVQVIFQGYFRINVFGSLSAKGILADSIYFMKAISDTVHLTDTSTINGGWHGILWDNPATGYQMSDSSIFDYCVFKYSKTVDNFASGGAINTNDFSKIKFSNCAFYKNVAKISGGAIYTGNTTGEIFQNCSFIQNQAVSGGGGAFYSDWGSRPIILNCLFLMNKCKTDGGALWMTSNNPVIQNCSIMNNNASGNGGAICLNQSNAFVGNTIIANNKASGNGAISLNVSSPVFANNTIVNNLAQWNSGLDFASGASGAEFYNNIIWGNKNQSSVYNQININEADQAPIFSHCVIQPGTIYSGSVPAKSAIFDDTIGYDPLFVSPTSGAGDTYNATTANWRLKTSPVISPAINMGISNNQTANLLSTDFYNNPRKLNGFIDIGASEAYIGSISVNGTVLKNTTWIADTVLINGNVTIKDSVKLIVSPGTKVIFQGQFKLSVRGTLIAMGDKDDSIIFTKSKTMIGDGWPGINFDNCQTGAKGALTHNDTSYLQYCIFEYAKNMNPFNGGAISVCFFSKLVISNCIFRNDTADYGAAILISSLSNPVIKSNLFYGNHTYRNGGAIAIDSKSQPVIMNNFITNNSCFGYIYSEGGGIYVTNSNPVIVNNIMSNNYGSIGGGISIANNAEPVFSNNTVVFNYANQGGGIFNDNTTTYDIYNSLFWGNHAPGYSDQVDNEYKANFYNCNIQDYYIWDNFGGTWNDSANIISVDPGFIKLPFPLDSTGSGLKADYHISTFSGNINNGTTNIPGIILPGTDIFGNARINGGQIDIGAVENQGNKLEFIQQPVGASLCEGNTVTLSVVLSDTAKIQWQKDGQYLPGDTNKTFKIDSLKEYKDQGNYICVAWNAFGKVYSNPVLLQVLKNPTITEQPEGGMVSLGELYKLDSRADGATPLIYQWFKDGDSLPDENLFRLQIDSFAHLNEGTYLCRVSNNCGTVSSQSATLSLAPQICMVTALDSTANVVVFEKNYNIQYKEFNIYREGIYLGIFEKLGSVPSSSPGIYVDHVDPRAQAYLYKMTGVESNNEETDINLCQTHKTMHLRVSRGVPSGFQLDWDEYVGFPYSTYYIYRSVDGGKNFDTIHVMSSSTHSWTDYSAPSGYLLYFVAVEKKDGACYPDGKRKAGSDVYSQSVSNMEDNRIQNSGIPEINANKYEFSCSPNPFSDFTTISYKLPVQSDVRLEVYNLLGEKVVTLVNTKQLVGLHQYRFSATEYGLSSGVYFIQFKTGGNVIMKKLVETK
jgi:Secretion system C-terminal sorting domain